MFIPELNPNPKPILNREPDTNPKFYCSMPNLQPLFTPEPGLNSKSKLKTTEPQISVSLKICQTERRIDCLNFVGFAVMAQQGDNPPSTIDMAADGRNVGHCTQQPLPRSG